LVPGLIGVRLETLLLGQRDLALLEPLVGRLRGADLEGQLPLLFRAEQGNLVDLLQVDL